MDRFTANSDLSRPADLNTATASEKIESLLRATLEGTAAVTGPEFFDTAVEVLAHALGIHTAFVAVPILERPGWNRLVAHWSGQAAGQLMEYPVHGAPGELMSNRDVVLIPSDVRKEFPDDEWLRELDAASYVALPLTGSGGHHLGHVGLVDTKPRHLSHNELSSLRIFGSRIAAELDRLRIDTEVAAEIEFQARFAESAPFGVTHRNLVTGAIWNNKAFVRIVGYSYQRCRELGWDRVVHPEDFDTFERDSDLLRTTGETVSTNIRLLHPDGDLRWIQRHGAAKLDAAGNPVEITTTITDMTARAKAHQELRATTAELDLRNAELEASLNAVPDLRFRLSANGTYLSAWAGDPDELLLPAEQIVGTHIADYFSPTVTANVIAAIKKTLDTGVVTSVEYRLTYEGVLRHYEARLAPIGTDEVMAVIRDVSNLKALEEQLVHASTMQSIGRLAGGVAHDFNNVLHVIRGHATALKRGSHQLETTTGRRLDAITRAVDRTSSLIERLMTISRPSPDNPRPTEIDSFLDGLAPTLAQMLGETISLELDLGADRAVVEIDDHRLESAVLNLVSNAKDSMVDGGVLTIATSVEESAVRISLSDTGVGMDRETATQIFEPFFTTKSVGVGTGFGLTTTYSTVIGANGTISVNSAPGEGATFVIELPATSRQPAAAPIATPDRPPATTANGITILIVEDEEDVLELCAGTLTDLGYHVLQAGNGLDALTLLRNGTQIDAVLTDVVMPGLTGPELAEEITGCRPGTPILYMSGYAPEAVDADVPPDRLLRKPFTDADLQRILTEHLP